MPVSVWTDGLPGIRLNQMVAESSPETIANCRVTCKPWCRQLNDRLSQLKTIPLLERELRVLSTSFPNVHHLSISRGRSELAAPGQTEHIVALTSFSTFLFLESISRLWLHELHVLLHDLPFLKS